MYETGGALGSIFILFLIVVSVMAFLVPLFIFRIRNEVIAQNAKLSIMIDLLNDSKTEIICKLCGSQNNKTATKCKFCGSPLGKI